MNNLSTKLKKELVGAAPILKYFDESQQLVIQCDTSQTGLGAALMQNRQPD